MMILCPRYFLAFWSMHREYIMAHLCFRHLSSWWKAEGTIQAWCLVCINWIKNNELKMLFSTSSPWRISQHMHNCLSTEVQQIHTIKKKRKQQKQKTNKKPTNKQKKEEEFGTFFLIQVVLVFFLANFHVIIHRMGYSGILVFVGEFWIATFILLA